MGEPYAYRKMSPEEREQVLAERRSKGFPTHAPPHPVRVAGAYFITSAIYEHELILDKPERLSSFEQQLLAVLKSPGFEVMGWVVVPNHYHLLLMVESFEDLAYKMKLLHGTTAREWNREDQLTGKRRVWYRYFDHAVRNEKEYYEILNYIHHNPVKHGWVDDVDQWQWSSLPLYADDLGTDWLREKWKRYRPGERWSAME